MWKIAWWNLYRDKTRFGTAVVGLVFSVVLMAVQSSIFLGAVRGASVLVRSADAELWIVPQSTTNADFSVSMPGRRRYQVLGVPGVEQAGRMIVGFGNWKFPDGRQESVIVVGTDTNRAWLPIPYKALRGRTAGGYGLALDRRDVDRFGLDGKPMPLGTRGELNGHRVHLAGEVHGMGSFTITPYAFTSFKAGLDLTRLASEETVFIMVKCSPGANVNTVRKALQARLTDVEVLTREEFAGRSWRYWVMGTGMGYSLVLMAILALIVGTVVVGQTFVTGVMVKIREYGTLKALGFENRFVAGVILLQGVIVSLVGYALGCGGAMIMASIWGSGGTAVNMYMPPILFLLLLPLTLFICLTSSMMGAWRVFRLAPADVFR